jgi:hypothetical protein
MKKKISNVKRRVPVRTQARTRKGLPGSYYEKLLDRMEASMERHPHSAVALDANTLEEIAASGDVRRLSKKLKSIGSSATPLVFERPKPNQITILFQV